MGLLSGPLRDDFFMYRKTGRKKVYISTFSVLTAAVMLLSSCGLTEGEEGFSMPYSTVSEENEDLSMEKGPVLEYDMPQMIPGVLVDRDGYSRDEVKFALCFSEKLPDTYEIYRTDNNERVYVGTPEEIVFDEESGKYSAKLIFENIDEDGEYYIFADKLGSSFSFKVDGTYYQDIYWDIVTKECEKIRSGNASLWETYCVLYSYERYKDVLYALKEDAPDVPDAVGSFISLTDFDSLAGTDAYVGISILAKFGYNYKALDEALAKECIQKAASMYKSISAISKENPLWNDGTVSDEKNASFLALAELYRTTATGAYSTEIVSMHDYLTAEKSMYDSKYVLYGAMGYMTAKYKVDRKFCDAMMENLLYKCRDMRDDKELIRTDSAVDVDRNELLMYAQQFAAMNYILDGYEYNELILNIGHFMSGRNTDALDFNIAENDAPDAVAVYAWLAWLENNGKLDPNAPVVWNYSW